MPIFGEVGPQSEPPIVKLYDLSRLSAPASPGRRCGLIAAQAPVPTAPTGRRASKRWLL
jgi:hypothetical protein